MLSDSSSDDMYVGDKVSKKPSGKSSLKGAGNSTKGQESDTAQKDYHRKEKDSKERIHSLEQEVIKLQLQNSYLTIKKPSVG